MTDWAKYRETNRLASQRYRERKRKPLPGVTDLPGEEWRPVRGVEDRYAVSNLGRVKSLARIDRRPVSTSVRPGKLWDIRVPERLRTLHVGRGGYLNVGLSGTGRPSGTHSVHVLVCEAFHGPRPDGAMALHANDDRLDNRASNLRWGTCQENVDDAVRNGRLRNGEDHTHSIFTDEEAGAVRALAGRIPDPVLAEAFDCNRRTLWSIRAGRNYPNAPSVHPSRIPEIIFGRSRGAAKERAWWEAAGVDVLTLCLALSAAYEAAEPHAAALAVLRSRPSRPFAKTREEIEG